MHYYNREDFFEKENHCRQKRCKNSDVFCIVMPEIGEGMSISISEIRETTTFHDEGSTKDLENIVKVFQKNGLGASFNAETKIFTLNNSAELTMKKVSSFITGEYRSLIPEVLKSRDESGNYQISMIPKYSSPLKDSDALMQAYLEVFGSEGD